VLNLKSRSRERELRTEIQTMKKLRDQQVAQYTKKLDTANAKLQAANLQVQLLQAGKIPVEKHIQQHRGKVRGLLRSQEFLTLVASAIAAIAFLAGVGGVLAGLLM